MARGRETGHVDAGDSMRKLLAALIFLAGAAACFAMSPTGFVYPVDRSGQYGVSLYPVPHPDCESIGYVHAWEYLTTVGVTLLYCLEDPGCNDPVPTRVCRNCGKRQIKPKPKRTEWEDVK